jgi:hypothetical protein
MSHTRTSATKQSTRLLNTTRKSLLWATTTRSSLDTRSRVAGTMALTAGTKCITAMCLNLRSRLRSPHTRLADAIGKSTFGWCQRTCMRRRVPSGLGLVLSCLERGGCELTANIQHEKISTICRICSYFSTKHEGVDPVQTLYCANYSQVTSSVSL